MSDKKLFHPTVCPVCKGEARHLWRLKVALTWLAIVAVSFWILLNLVGFILIAGIAKHGPTWPQ